jgi:hypothetical protein
MAVKNKLQSGSLDSLEKDQVLLVGFQETSNPDEIQAIVVHSKVNPTLKGSDSLLTQIYKGDPRFNSSSSHIYGWKTGLASEWAAVLDIPKIADVAEYETQAQFSGKNGIVLNILNPVTVNGDKLGVEITESTEPTEYQSKNVATRAKQDGNGNYTITSEGKPIFRNTSIKLLSEVKDTFILHSELQPIGYLEAYCNSSELELG